MTHAKRNTGGSSSDRRKIILDEGSNVGIKSARISKQVNTTK